MRVLVGLMLLVMARQASARITEPLPNTMSGHRFFFVTGAHHRCDDNTEDVDCPLQTKMIDSTEENGGVGGNQVGKKKKIPKEETERKRKQRETEREGKGV